MGEAKNTVPPNTWSGTRPDIIIIANLLPNMFRGGHAREREGGELLVHRRGPGPGSRRSSLEKPSSTRAGGRGERWGVPHCLEEKEKTKSWVNARNFQVSIHRETKSLSKKSIFGCEEKI